MLAMKINLKALDAQPLRKDLADLGRCQAVDIFDAAQAGRLAQAAAAAEFKLSVNSGPKSMDLVLAELEQLNPDQREQMTALIHAGAQKGFQYCFDSYRLSDLVDEGRLMAGPLFEFYRELNSAPVLESLRGLAQDPDIAFCDAQVTRYRPGHFLTQHDDEVAGKHRSLAFVLNLTPQWRTDWGGVLLFHGPEGRVEGGYAPRFNALNLFKVPQAHSVSLVAPFAAQSRLSITGWVRRRA